MNKLLFENINRLWASLIIDEFLKNKISHFYLSPGMRNTPLIAALVNARQFNKNIKIISCIDERAAGFRSLGYSKVTGLPSVLICTSGSAVAHYMPAIIEAHKSQLPLIVLSADRPPELTASDDNQTINQTNFFGSYTQGEMCLGAPCFDITPRSLTSTLSNLIYKSLFPQKGPVHLNCAFREPLEKTLQFIPENYLNLAQLQIDHDGPSSRYLKNAILPEKDDLLEIAHLLKNAQSGLLVIGSLAPSESLLPLITFIKKLNWPAYFDISSSLKYQFNLTDNSVPTFDHPEVQDALIINPPDIIFHIGGRLTSKHYYAFLQKIPSIQLITLNLNKEKEDPSQHTKIRINADVNLTLTKLEDLLGPEIRKEKKLDIPFETFARKKIALIDNGPLSYPLISKVIIDHIVDHSILYIGNSTVVRSFDAYFSYTNRKNLTIATNRGASGIEGFIASSCGLIDGLEKSVYLIIGDVSFLHDFNSLYFLKDLTIPLKIILVNNNGGGLFTLLPIHRETEIIDYITTPHGMSFKKAAELFEIDYIEVKDHNDIHHDLVTAFQALQDKQHHCLMEIFVDNTINQEIYQQLKTIKL